ncbi:MAG TPA: alkaline phosphatase family protein [Candidatus Angelobacter sp.]|jgi:hypothetical protein|nr:alkaline phosphatase family protein [Candidatus Angelobacter sp.]
MPRRLPILVTAALLAALSACGTPSAGPTPSGGATPSASAGGPTPTAPAGPPPHVMVIVLENQEYDSVVGNRGAPYFNKLAQQYGLATDYHARTHPSLPNYIDLIAGSTMGISSDCTDCNVDGDTVVDQLNKAGVHWTAYMGGMPSVCFQGAEYPAGTVNGYAKKHNPFLYFDHLRTDASACQNDVPLSQLNDDFDKNGVTPFAWISPSLCDDGHNTDCGLPAGDRWLNNNIPMVLGSSWYASGGVVIVTFDEGTSDSACCGGAHGGHVATLVISKNTRPGQRLDTPVDHAGTLRTIEALYGLSYLNTSADPQSGDLMPLLGRSPAG